MSAPVRILLVDDDDVDRNVVRRALSRSSLDVEIVEATDGTSGMLAFHDTAFDVVLLDYGLPDRDGNTVLAEILADSETPVPIIMLTGMNDEALALKLLANGAVDYLTKHEMGASVLERSIRYAMARQQVLLAEVSERWRCVRLAEEKSQLSQELQETNAILEKRNQRLAELAETAQRFVDNVSHEFRTPLTVIKEYASILHEGLAGELDPEQREMLEIILRRVEDLSVMINDMLDASKLEAGLLGFARRECRLADIVRRLGPTLESRARAADVRLEADVEDALPDVYCDPEKIGRVIVNLVGNACKYASAGGRVRIWARLDAEKGHVLVGVTDDGSGMSAEVLETVFNRFEQGGDSQPAVARPVGGGGVGLGLDIAKELVRLNFGDIAVESKAGSGTTFTFSVPLADPDQLLERFIRRLRGRDDHDGAVSLIRARVDDDVTRALQDDVTGFLHGQLRTDDLMFQAGAGAWLIVVPRLHREALVMLERLGAARELANRHRLDGSLPAIDFEIIGSWLLGDDDAELLRLFRAEHALPSERGGTQAPMAEALS